MKKLLSLLLAVCTLASFAAISASALGEDKVDARMLEKYGQFHWYLGDAKSSDSAPNAEDGRIGRNEYTLAFNIAKDGASQLRKWEKGDDKGETDNYVTCKDYMFYMDYDSKYIYVAFSKIDPDFVAASPRPGSSSLETNGVTNGDGFRFSLGMMDPDGDMDRGDSWGQISRMFFDVHFDKYYTPVFDVWASKFGNTGTQLLTTSQRLLSSRDYVKKSSGSYDKTTGLLTVEFAIDIDAQLDFWDGTNLEWCGVFLKVHRFGANRDGSKKDANQGRLDCCFDYIYQPSHDELREAFRVGYPNAHFFAYRAPNIVHFHDKGEEGDCPVHKHVCNFGTQWSHDNTHHWRSCKCGEKQTYLHSWNGGVVTKKPTYTEMGEKTFTCFACGYSITEPIDKLDPYVHTHSYGVEWESDETSHFHACECGDKRDTAAHSWNAGVVIKAPTFEEDGEMLTTCSVCEYESIIPISKLDITTHTHSYGAEWESNKNSHFHVCECGDKQDTADHTWNEGVVTKEPTVDKKGKKTFTCTVCGYEKTEYVDKLPAPAEEKSGCDNSISLAALAVLPALAVAFVAKKKED